jgi:flagellar biosynthetic protein FliQ
MEVFRDALLTALKLSAPVLVASVAVGLVISILQAATQIHEQTLTFVPKLIAIGVMLLFLGPWMLEQLNEFTQRLFSVMIQTA